MSDWLAITDQIIPLLNDQSIIIGHSIGATFALRLLERLDRPIQATALVAGFINHLPDDNLNAINHTFYDQAWNWPKIIANAGVVGLFCSDNDPFVPFDRSVEMAGQLQTKPIIVKQAGHFNLAAGFSQFPLLSEWLKQPESISSEMI